MTNPTLLQSAATDLATALETAASAIGWEPAEVCVMPYEPVSDCTDGIYVWPSSIDPRHEKGCQVSSLVELTFWLVQCSNVSDCGESVTHSPVLHSNVWGTWAGLLNAWKAGSIFTAPCQCEDVRFGRFALVEGEGGQLVWSGTVNVPLSPVEV